MDPRRENLNIQKWVVAVAIGLFIVKIAAYYLTHSVAILTDALEGIVNVVAGIIGWYSLLIAARPRDENHPYGHGKAEFVSATIEGTLITVAGALIIYKGISSLLHPKPILRLDTGIILVGITAVVNFIIGTLSIRKGKKNNSLALIASGNHLRSDTYSTLGIIAGLFLIYFTGLSWLDSIVAITFALVIIYIGYRIVRKSIAGIMDEADIELLTKVVSRLNDSRRENWIDLHNLRVIKYGAQLHVDCHLTVPWYLNVHEAHHEIDELSKQIREEFGDVLEVFVHSDGCQYFQCSICSKADCPVRQHTFRHRIVWTLENLALDRKHSPETLSVNS